MKKALKILVGFSLGLFVILVFYHNKYVKEVSKNLPAGLAVGNILH